MCVCELSCITGTFVKHCSGGALSPFSCRFILVGLSMSFTFYGELWVGLKVNHRCHDRTWSFTSDRDLTNVFAGTPRQSVYETFLF